MSGLRELLAPYMSLVKGEEMNMRADPVYQTLYNSPNPVDRHQAEGDYDTSAYGSLQEMVRAMAKKQYGWGDNQWASLRELVQNESGWNPQADNPTSSAYGLFQFLSDTWGSGYGGVNAPTSDPADQTRAGLAYIQSRYGNPRKALDFWQSQSPHYY